ncbi:MAG TPA: DUF2244 domain-containing protein [Rhizomicrobium sp.]
MMDTAVEPLLFDATLRPNPPMRASALKLVVGCVAVVNLGFGVLFVLRGAWPVTPFMGADVLFLAWALNAARVASRAYERVRLTPSSLFVWRQPARGEGMQFALNPYWVRVDMDDPPTRTSPLMLWSHGRGLQIGKCLVPEERLSLARALRSALTRARETRLA